MAQSPTTAEPKPPFPKQKLEKPGIEAELENLAGFPHL